MAATLVLGKTTHPACSEPVSRSQCVNSDFMSIPSVVLCAIRALSASFKEDYCFIEN